MNATLGTRLRHLLQLLDGGVEHSYTAAGLPGYRPRYTPVVRALQAHGPLTIRALAEAAGLSHSALSQTVAQMARAGWVCTEPGADARSKRISMSPALLQALPLLTRHWRATARAAATLDEDIGASLADVAGAAIAALEQRPFEDRIQKALSRQGNK
ncbi:MarR family winged helix-turn-helix transcriptional regulator [Luteimonas suaedae]|uniref:MarR family winged helix-turn-helix transcriptional regulator n=1 Tax=Luteimonas suaedae TaxID=2605430 RepID=UPI0011EE4962|nr:helix-turn-helix domain-containing protein [Luteimonas suaedae]